MGQMVSLDERRIEKALKKGQKNGQPIDVVALYVSVLIFKIIISKDDG